MATHDYVISNASGAAVRADLNNALAAIVSNNSSATEPSTTYAYQWWADIGSSPAVMKLRNAANDDWIELFQLDGEWSTIALEDGTAATPSLYFKDSGTDTGIYSPGSDQVAISTSATERMRISHNGVQTHSFDAAATTKVIYNWSNNTTGMSFQSANTERGNIYFFDTGVQFNTTSDYRLKENIQPVQDGISRLLRLKPSRFNFKIAPDKTVDGFIAHEVQEVVPESITGEKDAVDENGNPKYQNIDHSKLVPLLTAALQEAIGEIESLKARLTAAGI